MKANGSRLVGQCEISHPIRSPSVSITLEGEDDDLLSPVDDLDGTIRKPSNVLFEATKKGEYQPLDSRVSSKDEMQPLFLRH